MHARTAPRICGQILHLLVLSAARKANLYAGVLNCLKTENKKVYLTLLCGGAFGNHKVWILCANERALRLHVNNGFDVVMVGFGQSDPDMNSLVWNFS